MRARYFMVFAMVLSFAMVALADDGPLSPNASG
jgi:hypothetical protein